MLAAIGSTMTAATCSSSRGTTLYGTTIVSDTAARGTPAVPGQAERGDATATGDEEGVGGAVEVAGERDDAIAAGHATRQSHRRARRLGAGVHQADPLAARHTLADRLGQLHLPWRRRAVRRAVAGRGSAGRR